MTVDSDLLMELADCGSPEKLLSVIFKHRSEWRPPVPLEDFASSVGIGEIRALESDGFEGALITDEAKTRGAILFNARSARQRQRFTISHELGHFLIPTHRGNQQCTTRDMRETSRATERERREAEANRFAAGLLMPRHWFTREMNKLGDADVAHVRQLAKMFGASLEATANRYTDLTDDRCAFVFSKDGVVRYARASKDFPRLMVRAGQPLPADSFAASPIDQTGEWREIDSSVWLADNSIRNPSTILEQNLTQAHGYQTTLLFLEPANHSDEDEDEDEENDGTTWRLKFSR